MYADDLALKSDSEAGLHMLDIVSDYAHLWHYRFNISKSSVLVFGGTSVSRKKNLISRKWWLSGESIPECDTQHRFSAQYFHPLLFERLNVAPWVEVHFLH